MQDPIFGLQIFESERRIVAHGECVDILRPGDKTSVGKFEGSRYGNKSESYREAHA
jgi:hypothetical protein